MKGLIYAGLSLLLTMLSFPTAPVPADPEGRASGPPDIDDLAVW